MARGSDSDERIDGVMAALPVATPWGWRPAADLRQGDAVSCHNAPPQPILLVLRHFVRNPHAVRVPADAVGNPAQVLLLPDQTVALSFDQAAELYGDPVALIPARPRPK